MGVLSGVLGGALNEAGPPVVIYLTLKHWPKDDVKATLQVYCTRTLTLTLTQTLTLTLAWKVRSLVARSRPCRS